MPQDGDVGGGLRGHIVAEVEVESNSHMPPNTVKLVAVCDPTNYKPTLWWYWCLCVCGPLLASPNF